MTRPDRGTMLLLAGDLAVLVLFAILGRRTHEEATGIEAVGAVLGTAAPFLLAWLVAFALTMRSTATPSPTLAAVPRLTARAWLIAFPLAVLFRAAFLARFSPWTFYVVAGLMPLALLIAWRAVFVLAAQRGRGGATRHSSSSLPR